MLHVVPVPSGDLPEGQEWVFVEVDCELYVLLSESASGVSMERGLAVALGLLAECAEHRRAALPSQRASGVYV